MLDRTDMEQVKSASIINSAGGKNVYGRTTLGLLYNP